MNDSLEDRFVVLLQEMHARSEHGFWKLLEDKTGISSQRWRKVNARRQRPTPDMIEAIGKLQTKYAYWLITGNTHKSGGHFAPDVFRVVCEKAEYIEKPPVI